MSTNTKHTPELLKRTRLARGLSQAAAAREVGVDAQTYRNWETSGVGIKRLGSQKLLKMWLNQEGGR